MESPHAVLLVALIATFTIFHLAQAQDQDGFISLDCGLPKEESPYTDRDTGIKFSSDADYIQSGIMGRIDTSLEATSLKSRVTLRYFPDGLRNCYSLSVKQGTKYLMRATALYGNYDGHNVYPKFDLYIGPNFWVTLDLGKYVNGQAEEIIHVPSSNFLEVCLVKTGPSTPLISILELRPLDNDTYIITQLGSLKCFKRYYFSNSKSNIAYPEDVKDRIWEPKFEPEWNLISTTLEANNSNGYFVPQNVLKTAAVPANASAPFRFTKDLEYPNDQIYSYLHFSEPQSLQANESREFDFWWNGESVFEAYRPKYLWAQTIYFTLSVVCNEGECNIELKRTANSTLPPLLNAIEIYTLSTFPQLETNETDVAAVKSIKAAYGLNRITWQGDPCVPQQFLWDGLNCNNTNTETSTPTITYLNLSSSGLTGTILAGIKNLTHLEKLDLSNNQLTGEIPEFLANMKSLMLINLSKNKLNGLIPQALLNRENKGLKLTVDEEHRCSPGSCVKKKKFPVLIVALISLAVVVIVVVLILIFVCKKKRASNLEARAPSMTPPGNVTSIGISDTSIETKRKRFSNSEVMKMTNNLQKPLGEGGFGVVYHGNINGSQEVAVKLLSQSSTQGYKEFKAEVELLLRVHHINLVSLVGYCDERDHLALIYEYMSNKDLKHQLSGKDGGSVLKWSTRLQVAIDAALGLEYLHIGCRPSMVHRDVKSTNILLDERFTAKIADFGLSRSFQIGDESQVSTVVAGTPGYLDPEYYKTGRLAETSDVYSFGIVLLEIITNQHVIDQTRVKSHITDWTAFMLNRGDIASIMDPTLQGNYNSHSVWRAIEVAMLCANPSSEKRPSLSQVVTELKECLSSENSTRNNTQEMDSHSSSKQSMSFDTNFVPSAR